MSRRNRPSATSLPPSPRDDESSRVRHYLLTMGIRVVCLLLMVFVQPYGWYTWLFGAAAIVLPYIAVVIANVGKDAHEKTAESPERALPAVPTGTPQASRPQTPVIRIAETRPLPPAGTTAPGEPLAPDEPPASAATPPSEGDR